MILLDTHIWIWWVHKHENLPKGLLRTLSERNEPSARRAAPRREADQTPFRGPARPGDVIARPSQHPPSG